MMHHLTSIQCIKSNKSTKQAISDPIFVTGGTGYIGQSLITALLQAGHKVRALVRPGSEQKLPRGCEVLIGDALDAASFVAAISPCRTFVQLVGVPHPSPAKTRQFFEIDLGSARVSVQAALKTGIQHFVYVSVAQPAPIIKAYQQARAEAEALIQRSGLNATIFRPWYVLGPGHRWPYLLLPAYWLFGRLPSARDTSRRLGLVTLDQVTRALVSAVESPAQGLRIVTAPEVYGTQ